MPATANPEAPSSASLLALADQCVQCGLCLPHCPTYRLDATEGESPRGRIAYIKAVAGGDITPSARGDQYLDHCLGCRRCESVCPAQVRYGELLTGARALQRKRVALPWRQRFSLALLARPVLLGGLLAAYRRLFGLLPVRLRALPRPPRPGVAAAAAAAAAAPARPALPAAAPALPTPDAMIFIGCVARGYEGPARQALLRLLAGVGVTAAMPAGQGCCGAAAAHAGEAGQAAALAGRNRQALAGGAPVLCLASGCHEQLADSLDGVATVLDPLLMLHARRDRLRFLPASGRRVALHLPCTQRRVVGSQRALLELLAQVPDLDLVQLPDTGCCGAAGLHMSAHPARAAALRAPLLAALARTGAHELLSANIGCRLHLGNGSELPVRHPLEFLAEQMA